MLVRDEALRVAARADVPGRLGKVRTASLGVSVGASIGVSIGIRSAIGCTTARAVVGQIGRAHV